MEYFICHLKGARLLVGKGVTWCDQHCTILPVNGKSSTDLVALARFFIPHFCLGPLVFSNESQCNCVLPGVAIAWGMWRPQFLTASQPANKKSQFNSDDHHLPLDNKKNHVIFNSLQWWFLPFCHVFGGKWHCKSKWDNCVCITVTMYLQLKYTDTMHYSFHTRSCLGRLHDVCLEGFG